MSNKYWTLYVRVISNQRFDRNGGQGRNRTTDTRIFSPQKSSPSSTEDHLNQPIRKIENLAKCSRALVGDAGLGTKVETKVHSADGLRNRAPALFLARGRIFLIRYGGTAAGINALRRVSLSLCRTM